VTYVSSVGKNGNRGPDPIICDTVRFSCCTARQRSYAFDAGDGPASELKLLEVSHDESRLDGFAVLD
jgi:hypothetical protein